MDRNGIQSTPGLALIALALIASTACSSHKVAEQKPETPPNAMVMPETKSPPVVTHMNRPPRAEIYPTAHFDFDSAVLKKEDRKLIHRQANELMKSGATVLLVGACDERGSEAYNMKLGLRRASAVQSELRKWGVSMKKIQVRSVGKSQPIAFGHDEASWALNRRAEMQALSSLSPVASR